MIDAMGQAIYDRIGRGYAQTRRPDPRIGRAIDAALAGAASVVNVGAGAGSYEPRERSVLAVEPSAAMLAQRPPDAAPAIQATAEALPFRDASFAAALAILTVHHWSDRRRGLAELARVSRERVVLFTWEPEVGRDFWLLDYFPSILALDLPRFPPLARLAEEMGGRVDIRPVRIPRDCEDGFLGAWWARPDAYLDARVRAGISCFNQIEPQAVESGLARLEADLASGAWQSCFGSLQRGDELDLGYRLVVRLP